MLVQEIMSAPVVTVDVEASLMSAFEIMQQKGIRHLPVLQHGRLIGIVSDRDLRLATSMLRPEPFAKEARVAEVMTQNPVTATPLDPVEEAARLMHEHKIGCLPIVENDQLVGVVTGPDLLGALIRLTGITRPGGRLAVRLDDAPRQLSKLIALLAAREVAIHSILNYPDATDHPYVILRLNTLNTRTLADDLRVAGFEVLWPPEQTWSP